MQATIKCGFTLESVCDMIRTYSQFSTLLCKFHKLLGTLFILSTPNLCVSDFKLAKRVFLAKSDVSTSAAFLKSAFVV